MDDPASRPNMGVRHDQSMITIQTRRNKHVRSGYLLAFLVLIALYPLLPTWGRSSVSVLASLAAIPAVFVGSRRIDPRRRRFWVLLLAALTVVSLASVLSRLPGDPADSAARLLGAAGNLLVLAAALTLVSQQRSGNIGRVIDATIVALAVGGLLWDVVLFPNLIPTYQSGPAKLALCVVVFALCGVLGALVQVVIQRRVAALRPLILALALALGSDIVLALTTDSQLNTLAAMMSIGAFTAVGLVGLDPTAAQLVAPAPARPDRLSRARLAFLGLATAAVPIVVGARLLAAGDPDGLVLLVSSTATATLVMARIGQLTAQRDQAERALTYEATHDPLTGLPNRKEFVTQLGQELASDQQSAILFCDLDRFKSVNDRFGHAHGDQVLIEVAQRLRDCVRADDTVSRLGGDEFVILLRNTTPHEAQTTSQRIVDALARPVHTPGEPVTIGISTGTALATTGSDPEELIDRADHAMYASKTSDQARPTP
jgi:diguanylate cyclase (GGDEF)-like protein